MIDPTPPPCAFGPVHFGILWVGSDLGMTDFEAAWASNARHVPGSNRTITQLTGKGPSVATYRISLDSVADFRALEALIQTNDTLTLINNMTTAPGTFQRIVDQDCILIPDVLLLTLTNRIVGPEMAVDCDATFSLANS